MERPAVTGATSLVAAVPAQSFTHTSHSDANAEDLWKALNQPATWEAIGGVDRVFDPIVDDNGDLRGFSFATVVAGKPYEGRARPREREEPRLISWDIANSEIRGVTRVVLSPNASGTGITVTLEMESVGLLSRVFFPVIASAVGNGLPDAVESFAAEMSQRA